MKNTTWLPSLTVLALAACGSSTPSPQIPEGTTLKVALLETTDLHQNVRSYDYYALKDDPTFGLERTSTLISGARQENPNNVLLDDGDNIQGTLLGDYQAVASPVPCNSTMGIHKVMNALKFDGGGVGNHEFNYGLGFLSQITNTNFGITGITAPNNCGAPSYPVVLANVVNATTQAPIFNPYSIIPKKFSATAPDGTTLSVTLNVGIMGFVPPQILDWDQQNLAGKVAVNGVVESANKYVPEMRSKGADLIVALSHGGLDAAQYSPKMENGSLYLSTTGIDALMLGHSHLAFPLPKEAPANPAKPFVIDATLANLPGVDTVKGLVNGIPAVMAESWGKRLGIIQMVLKYQGGKWVIQKDQTNVEARGLKYVDGINPVAADPAITALIDPEHQATIAYATQSLGATTDFEMQTYFAMLGDSSALQIVNQAQIDYVKNFIANSKDATLASYKSIPVISCAAPFKAGRNGLSDFTDVAPKASSAAPVTLQVRDPGNLYLYGNNTVQAVKIKGSDLKKWLETTASQFTQINPSSTADQNLLTEVFPVYNYDVFYATGNALQYTIDVRNPVNSRIASLTYLGKPVADTDDFIVATNNYRASGGGGFPGIDGSKTIISSPDANQAVVSKYISTLKTVTKKNNGSDRSWSFVKFPTAGAVYLNSAPGKTSLAPSNVISEGSTPDAKGRVRYGIDLSK
ncbi:bifunctional 2',3'-cyclic-nucleotide 2'-phosphodiesterase/3'-nucleotidase [Undibacterium jejuense]|uniref:Bifunctional 2',3'-cyclic-nucleotide 2'-phosphodiesterase/3'-nucleotidase n=1 Tax=Undibacterium jejuense TaxID=1344949 RepID=A0A923HD09_9BURK|nr:bifunctional 2',3'-cyclic-nucleotide 2'-phosphodiesterase/3'-nucleotidase [Undibacterium jejuense]MBC3861751.1 bifunctional 2',3'-cyclic-nucleotide 2'-phosphodiesterase/3'-nucleotidase [Undibacterium jejuense]